MVEERFKPADVGTVADGSVTAAKLAANAVTAAKIAAAAVTDPKIASSFVKGAAADTSGDKKVNAIGWDSLTSEVVVDHAV